MFIMPTPRITNGNPTFSANTPPHKGPNPYARLTAVCETAKTDPYAPTCLSSTNFASRGISEESTTPSPNTNPKCGNINCHMESARGT